MLHTFAHTNATKTRILTTIWTVLLGILLIGGAIYLKVYDLQGHVRLPALQAFLRSDYFHVPAHLLLYGTLTAGCRALIERRWWLVLLAVLAVGLLQEGAQSLLFGRAMGSPEVF